MISREESLNTQVRIFARVQYYNQDVTFPERYDRLNLANQIETFIKFSHRNIHPLVNIIEHF